MSETQSENTVLKVGISQVLYECPECGDQALGASDQAPGHIHGDVVFGEGDLVFHRYVPADQIEDRPVRRRRPRANQG